MPKHYKNDTREVVNNFLFSWAIRLHLPMRKTHIEHAFLVIVGFNLWF